MLEGAEALCLHVVVLVVPVLAALVVVALQAIQVQPPELMVLGAEAEAEAMLEEALAGNPAEAV